MALTWLSNLFKGSVSTSSVGMPGGSATYTAPKPTTTTTITTNPQNAYADRMKALESYYRTRYNATTGVYAQGTAGAWRRPTSAELAGSVPRTGYASPYNRTQQEYLTGQNLRSLNGFMPGTGMSQEEWIRRQRAAPLGYTYTPYAGWTQTPNASGAGTAPGGGGGDMYAGGGGGGYGYGDGGAGGGGSLPSWYENFLNQMNWRI